MPLWTGLGLGTNAMDDAGYREVAGGPWVARVEFRDEIASLKRENAALKRKVGRKPRGGGSAAGHGPVVEDDPDSSLVALAVAARAHARPLPAIAELHDGDFGRLRGDAAAHVSLSFFVPFLTRARRQLRRHERGRRHLGDRARRRAHAVF